MNPMLIAQLVLMIGVFYFLIIMPKNKKIKLKIIITLNDICWSVFFDNLYPLKYFVKLLVFEHLDSNL